VTAKELAGRFGVSQRTIYRDVDTLSLSGIPVYTEKGKGGGISLLPDYVLSKSILSDKEQDEILSALRGLSNLRVSETEQVLQKLSGVFNKSAANWLEVDFTDWSYSNGALFTDFKTAVLEHRIAEFDYYGANGEKTSRRVEPLKLWFKSRAWYIHAYCLTRRDIRLFKLSRVKNLVLSDETFIERDLLQMQTDAPAESCHLPDVTLKLKIGPEMAYRVYDEFHEDMVEKQTDSSYIVTVDWPEDEWVYGTILSYGGFVEVLEPEHVRRIIKHKAQEIAKKYL